MINSNANRSTPAGKPSGNRGALIVIGAGGILFLASLAWSLGLLPGIAQEGNLDIEVVTGETLFAIHEMEPFDPTSIPFLPADQPQPAISGPESYYDFGQIGPTDKVSRDFLIFNNGQSPLTISRAYTTCGCTTAEFSATVIPPGKAANMKLVFDAGFHDVSGQTVRRGVIIENNDPNNSQFEIWVQASVSAQ